MSKMSIGVAAVAISALALFGCGSTDEGAATESPATGAPAAESPAAEASSSVGWTTATTLNSTDPASEIGLLVSEEFAAAGDVRIVLDMSGAGELAGVVGTLIPAGAEVTVDAASEGEPVTVAAAAPKQVISGLDGRYVLVVSVSTGDAWSLDIQTKP
jgi:hypothetical protein